MVDEMATRAVVLADSISRYDYRLTTLEVTFPRYILAEMNTHRVFSRNSASSRAIPVERQLRKVLDDPFIPERFPKNQAGMSAGEFFERDSDGWVDARLAWLAARDHAVRHARWLLEIGVHKQVVNRLLEPFMQHTAIISSTEWDNFIQLRTALRPDGEPVSDPEMYHTALAITAALYEHQPIVRTEGEWHLPLVTDEEREAHPLLVQIKLSASRCARSSYERQHDDEPVEKTVFRAESLAASGHLSPWEHPAAVTYDVEQWANFRGWGQGRWYLERKCELPA